MPTIRHTVGPMKSARAFTVQLAESGAAVDKIQVTLHGSLAYTGKGHGTDSAIILGLMGCEPETLDPDAVDDMLRAVHSSGRLNVSGVGDISFSHTNGMRFIASNSDGQHVLSEDYYSLGGGFVARGDEPESASQSGEPPYPFTSGAELLAMAEQDSLTIAELVELNERQWRSKDEIRLRLMNIWSAMQAWMAVTRRAAKLHRKMLDREEPTVLDAMDWVNVYAIAVNEENAAGGRVVTSPTNGAAGIIPAVLHYYSRFVRKADDEGIMRFLLVAGAIGTLYKINASISGAEMGCQGEVGVACSMAAAGLVAAKYGTNSQIENAAEIGMEHNLGLTCDPVGGLVQIPCIERNAMGAVKAINAARLAMHGDGSHKVTLDQVISTMRQTGLDMSTRYKETSEGGLAVNVPEC